MKKSPNHPHRTHLQQTHRSHKVIQNEISALLVVSFHFNLIRLKDTYNQSSKLLGVSLMFNPLMTSTAEWLFGEETVKDRA